jgi:hypothetical protein
VLAAVIYFSLRVFALPATVRVGATLVVIWLYILVDTDGEFLMLPEVQPLA